MTITTPVIQAQHALCLASSGDCIDWATDSLCAGLDSPNLRILAGLDRFVSTFEAEQHFLNAIKELGLPSPTKEQALRDYAVFLAQCILEPTSNYNFLVKRLSWLCYTNNYPKFMMAWYNLDDGLADIHSGGYPHSYEQLYNANVYEVVMELARRFINENSNPANSDQSTTTPD